MWSGFLQNCWIWTPESEQWNGAGHVPRAGWGRYFAFPLSLKGSKLNLWAWKVQKLVPETQIWTCIFLKAGFIASLRHKAFFLQKNMQRSFQESLPVALPISQLRKWRDCTHGGEGGREGGSLLRPHRACGHLQHTPRCLRNPLQVAKSKRRNNANKFSQPSHIKKKPC